jgi:hypothetical protein
VTLLPFTHWTTEHGRMLVPVTVRVSAEPPTAMLDWESDVRVGATNAVAGVVIVNGSDPDVPNELETVTVVATGNAVSAGKMAAVS